MKAYAAGAAQEPSGVAHLASEVFVAPGMLRSRSQPALPPTTPQGKPARAPAKQQRGSSAWKMFEGFTKVFEFGSALKPESHMVQSLQKSHVLAETLDVEKAAYDPLTTDPSHAKFIKEHAPRVHYKRRMEYYRMAEPELRPPRPGEREPRDELILNEKLQKARQLGLAHDVQKSKMKGNQLNEHHRQLVRRQEVKEREKIRKQRQVAALEVKLNEEAAGQLPVDVGQLQAEDADAGDADRTLSPSELLRHYKSRSADYKIHQRRESDYRYITSSTQLDQRVTPGVEQADLEEALYEHEAFIKKDDLDHDRLLQLKREIDAQRVARERKRVLHMLLESEVKMTKLKSIAATNQDLAADVLAFDGGREEYIKRRAGEHNDDLRLEPRTEQDPKEHTPKFERSGNEVRGKLEYDQAPYLHSSREGAKPFAEHAAASSKGASEDWQVTGSQPKMAFRRVSNPKLGTLPRRGSNQDVRGLPVGPLGRLPAKRNSHITVVDNAALTSSSPIVQHMQAPGGSFLSPSKSSSKRVQFNSLSDVRQVMKREGFLEHERLDPEYFVKREGANPERDPEEKRWGKIANAILRGSRGTRQDLYRKARTGVRPAHKDEAASAQIELKRSQHSVRHERDGLYPSSARSTAKNTPALASRESGNGPGTVKSARQAGALPKRGTDPRFNTKSMTVSGSGPGGARLPRSATSSLLTSAQLRQSSIERQQKAMTAFRDTVSVHDQEMGRANSYRRVGDGLSGTPQATGGQTVRYLEKSNRLVVRDVDQRQLKSQDADRRVDAQYQYTETRASLLRKNFGKRRRLVNPHAKPALPDSNDGLTTEASVANANAEPFEPNTTSKLLQAIPLKGRPGPGPRPSRVSQQTSGTKPSLNMEPVLGPKSSTFLRRVQAMQRKRVDPRYKEYDPKNLAALKKRIGVKEPRRGTTRKGQDLRIGAQATAAGPTEATVDVGLEAYRSKSETRPLADPQALLIGSAEVQASPKAAPQDADHTSGESLGQASPQKQEGEGSNEERDRSWSTELKRKVTRGFGSFLGGFRSKREDLLDQ